MALDFPNSPTTGQIFTASNGTSWQWTGTAWVAAGTATGLITGAPNKLINPFMEIDQANEGGSVNPASTSYVADGYKATMTSSAGGASSALRGMGTGPPGYPASLQLRQTVAASSVAAGDLISLFTVLEADDLADTEFGTSSAQTLTLAFWANVSIAGTYYVAFRNASTATRTYVAPFTVTTANAWYLYAIIIPGDTAGTWTLSGNGFGLAIWWTLASGTSYQTTPNAWQAGSFLAGTGMNNAFMTTASALFMLGPCGLWVAPAAQPLLRTSFQAELARCQRYYEKSYNAGVRPGTAVGTAAATGGWFGNGTAAQLNMGAPVAFKVAKRATPTTTIYDNAGTAGNMSWYSGSAWNNGLSAGAGGPGPSQSWMAVTQLTGGAVYYYNFDWVADARL